MTKALKALAAKKTLFALVLALTIFGAVYGFAATLNVGTNQLSAGNATVASCQSSGTPTAPTRSRTTRARGYKVSGVTVTALDTNCASKTISVTLTGASGTEPRHDHRHRSGRRRLTRADPRRRRLGGLGHRRRRRDQRLKAGSVPADKGCGRDAWRRRPVPQHPTRSPGDRRMKLLAKILGLALAVAATFAACGAAATLALGSQATLRR